MDTTSRPMSTAELVARREQQAIMDKFQTLLLMLAIGYGIIFLLSSVLVMYMRRNRTVAFRGNTTAARKIILPAFLPLLVVLMTISCAFSLYFCIMRFALAMRMSTRVETEVYYSGRLFLLLIVVVYMYQKSVSIPALRRASMITFVLASYNIPIVWLVDEYGTPSLAYWIPQFTRLLVVLFFLWVLVIPPVRASKRTLREYAVFALIYYVLYYAYSELFHQERLDPAFLMVYANIMWGSLCPLVIWRVLKADTEHWRGLGRRACALQSLFRQKHRMNERISSRGLHVLIEMHRKYIIDFAYLELKRKIGVGSSAVVFQGVLHSKTPVAVKVYTPTELTDELVAEFSHEAALCGALHHPNIVHFYGMCVCPPTICLVSELCQGSLEHITKLLAKRQHDIVRQQLLINLNYMIDATRAVAYLHSFAPAFLHRDIKPSNFLVDNHGAVKLTDFGESRSLPRVGGNGPSSSNPSAPFRLGLEPFTNSERNAMTVRGTAEYMPPEIIQGKAGTALYGEAADIYSLAMTLWDILYPLDDKYPTANGNHFKIFEAVLHNQRPALSSTLHPGLYDLLSCAWDARPDRRPSALYMLSALEKIQQEVSSDVATMLARAMDKKIMISKKGCTTETSFTGEALVARMIEFEYVGSVAEAIRTGNGFMSSGLLHHTRHAMGFESTSEQYMFDEDLLDQLQESGERLFVPPIVDRSRVQTDTDDDTSELRGVEPIMEQAELVHVAPTPGRKLSKASSAVDRRMSATSSQWGTATNPDPRACSCRRLGAGTVHTAKSQRRFRRGKKNQPPTSGLRRPGRDGGGVGGALYSATDTAMTTGVLSTTHATGRSIMTANNGLTEKLLSEFAHTGESAYGDIFDSSLSQSDRHLDLVVPIHSVDDQVSDEDEEDEEENRSGLSSLESAGQIQSMDLV